MSTVQALYPPWRVRHWLTPIPLPFTPSLQDFRQWKVETDPVAVAQQIGLPASGVLDVRLHRILIETGIALTLATSAWDPRSWFALYRYGWDFVGTEPRLRFYAGVREKDPRLAAVASEEVATGIACYILRERFHLTHIADALACIKAGELTYVNRNSGLRPDYFCEDNNGEAVLAESKGSIGTRCRITKRIAPEGWSQVLNVQPRNRRLRSSCGRLVIGTHFCIEGCHRKSETTTIIKDPIGEQGAMEDPDSDTVVRLAYAKCLRFMGQDGLAERLIARRYEPEAGDERLSSEQADGFVPMAFTPFGDMIGIYQPTLRALFSLPGQMRGAVRESLGVFREQRSRFNDRGYSLPNGVIVLHEWEDLPWER